MTLKYLVSMDFPKKLVIYIFSYIDYFLVSIDRNSSVVLIIPEYYEIDLFKMSVTATLFVYKICLILEKYKKKTFSDPH